MSIEETLGRIVTLLEKIAEQPMVTHFGVDYGTETVADGPPQGALRNLTPEEVRKKTKKKKKAKAVKKDKPVEEPKTMEAGAEDIETAEPVDDGRPAATRDELEELVRSWVTKLSDDSQAVALFSEFGETNLSSLKESNITPMYYAIKERMGEE